jgi:ferritin-like metal-binding protein YciE
VIELFVHRLRQLLWIEETLARETLPRLREHAHATPLTSALDRHLLETEGHVRNLGRVFVAIGERATAVESVVFRALQAEAEQVRDDVALIDVVTHSEHLEVAGYETLVHLAEALDVGVFQDVVYLLRTNLEQDAYALEELERVLVQLLAEQVEQRGQAPLRGSWPHA